MIQPKHFQWRMDADKAGKVGFDWNDPMAVLDKIEEEIGELREALASKSQDEAEGELGDIVFALVNLGRHLKIDAETALRRTNNKFRTRFHAVENALNQSGRTLDEASLDEMEALWQDAKKLA